MYKYFVSIVIKYTLAPELQTWVSVYLAVHCMAQICVTIADVVLSNIVLHLHVTYYCYDELCRYLHFTLAKHFVASYMIEHTCIYYDLVEIRHMLMWNNIV